MFTIRPRVAALLVAAAVGLSLAGGVSAAAPALTRSR
jgi:hypothetical protein